MTFPPTIDSGSLAWVITAEAVLFAVGVLLVMGNGAWLHVVGPRRKARLARSRAALNAALQGSPLSDIEVRQMAHLGLDLQVRLFGDVAASLSGDYRRRVVAAAADAGVLATAEASCRSHLWWRRLHGARLFTILGGGEAVMPSLFGDRRLEVRAQAAEWAVEHPTAETVGRLVAMLAAPEAVSRFAAQDALLRIGRPAVAGVVACLEAGRGPALEPAMKVAAGLGDAVALGPALRLAGHGSAGIRARAAEVLGAVGGDAAAGRLTTLLDDPEDEVVVAAARALGRLSHWPAAGRLTSLLHHPAWPVRQHAGLALRSLGPPGTLFLRRSVSDPDQFMGDMAKHVLSLPDSAAQALAS